MRYAVIADIHGNFPALYAVLKDAEQARVDKYIFVGDYAVTLQYPNEVVEKIKSMSQNSYIIRGNGEDYLENISKQDPSTWTDGQYRSLYWCYQTLTEENRSFLKKLSRRIDFVDNDVNIHVAHASEEFINKVERREFSPSKVAIKYANTTFSHEVFLKDINHYLSNDHEFQKNLQMLSDGVYIFGHTHLQWHAKFQNRVFINPGACGDPLDFSLEKVPYTILEIENHNVLLDERHVFYDKASLVENLKTSTLYAQATIWSKLVIRNLNTGYSNIIFFLNYAEEYANSIGDTVRPFSLSTMENAYNSWMMKRSDDLF